MKKRIFALLLCLVFALSLGGCQPEQIDYDTSPLSFETVFLSPEDSYEIEELPPEKGIIKGVFTYDYTEQGNGIRIHRFTLSYETADSITVRNTQIYGKGLQPVSFEGNEFAIDLRLTRPVPSNTSGLWFSGDFDYNGEEYTFNISL